MAQIRMLEVLNYSVNTLHGHGYTRIFTPDRYAADTSGKERVKAEGMVLVKKGLHYLNTLRRDRSFRVNGQILWRAGIAFHQINDLNLKDQFEFFQQDINAGGTGPRCHVQRNHSSGSTQSRSR